MPARARRDRAATAQARERGQLFSARDLATPEEVTHGVSSWDRGAAGSAAWSGTATRVPVPRARAAGQGRPVRCGRRARRGEPGAAARGAVTAGDDR